MIPRVHWSGRYLTPTGIEGCSRPRKNEEARLTPRGKQVPAAQRNGLFHIAISSIPRSIHDRLSFLEEFHRNSSNPQSESERKALDSYGNRGMFETPQAQLRRLDFLPVESKGLQRRGTDPSPLPPPQYREATHICH